MSGRLVFRDLVTFMLALAALSTAPGCQGDKEPGRAAIMVAPPPEMPIPMVGRAFLGGTVRGADGQRIAEATVLVAETDARVLTDEAGVYRIEVPSESTVTLLATAAGYAPTFHESILVAAGVETTQSNFRMLATAQFDAINALAAPSADGGPRGLMAIRLHSMDSACTVGGAGIAVWPPRAGTLLYSRPGGGGGGGDDSPMDQPDLALASVQSESNTAAWLIGALPPGDGQRLTVDRSGCRLLPQSPSLGGVIFSGRRHVATDALTEADLFLGAVSP